MINIPFIIKKKNPESEISENIDPEIKKNLDSASWKYFCDGNYLKKFALLYNQVDTIYS